MSKKKKLEQFMFGTEAYSEGCELAKLNGAVAGKSAYWIAQQAGFEIDPDTSIIIPDSQRETASDTHPRSGTGPGRSIPLRQAPLEHAALHKHSDVSAGERGCLSRW